MLSWLILIFASIAGLETLIVESPLVVFAGRYVKARGAMVLLRQLRAGLTAMSA